MYVRATRRSSTHAMHGKRNLMEKLDIMFPHKHTWLYMGNEYLFLWTLSRQHVSLPKHIRDSTDLTTFQTLTKF